MKIDFERIYEAKDIEIDGELILHINKNDEGYTFDLYDKKLYCTEEYDDGYLAGTYVYYHEYQHVENV